MVCSESDSEVMIVGVGDGGEGMTLGLRAVRVVQPGLVTRPLKMAQELACCGMEAVVLLERRVGIVELLGDEIEGI